MNIDPFKPLVFRAPDTSELKFVAEQEPWTIYRLEDGSVVRVRLVLVKAMETGRFADNGLPIIDFKFQQILDYEPTDEQKAAAERRMSEKQK